MKKKEHKIDSVEPGSIADEMGIADCQRKADPGCV